MAFSLTIIILILAGCGSNPGQKSESENATSNGDANIAGIDYHEQCPINKEFPNQYCLSLPSGKVTFFSKWFDGSQGGTFSNLVKIDIDSGSVEVNTVEPKTKSSDVIESHLKKELSNDEIEKIKNALEEITYEENIRPPLICPGGCGHYSFVFDNGREEELISSASYKFYGIENFVEIISSLTDELKSSSDI